jgi:hypothetical protein
MVGQSGRGSVFDHITGEAGYVETVSADDWSWMPLPDGRYRVDLGYPTGVVFREEEDLSIACPYCERPYCPDQYGMCPCGE